MKPELPDDFATLVADYLDRQASPEQVAKLSSILRKNEEARTRYLKIASVHAQLATEPALWTVAEEKQNVLPIRHIPRWWTWVSGGLAATLCVVVGVAWGMKRQPAEAPASHYIATVVLTDAAQWGGGAAWREGQRLTPTLLSLAHGTAVIRFDGGTLLLLRGKCRLELESVGSVRLLDGNVVARTSIDAPGFVLKAPAGKIVDLGGEFTVKVDASGTTEAHVTDGEIALEHERSPKPRVVLGSTKAVRFNAATAEFQEISPQLESLDDLLRALDRRDPGRLIALESFDYEPGEYAPSQLAGGLGWSGPWMLMNVHSPHAPYSGTSKVMRIVRASPLDGTDGFSQTAWETPPGKILRLRQLAHPISMAADGIVYMSALFREPKLMARDPKAKPLGTARIGLRSSKDFKAELLAFGTGSTLRPSIDAGGARGFGGRTLIQPGQDLFVIAKIISRKIGEDQVLLRIYSQDEGLDMVEPLAWDVVTRGLEYHGVFDLLLVSSGGPGARLIDDIKIGETWQSVVPVQRITAVGLE